MEYYFESLESYYTDPVFLVSDLVFYLISLVALWKVFKKAGKPGWAAIIPIYNIYTLIKVVKFNPWSLLLMFVPLVNFIFVIVLYVKLGEVFDKGVLFRVGLVLLTPVFLTILAFDNSKYKEDLAWSSFYLR